MPEDARAERARKIAQIEKLKRNLETVPGPDRHSCGCNRGPNDPTIAGASAEVQGDPLNHIRYYDEHTIAEHRRRIFMARLDANPSWEPPQYIAFGDHTISQPSTVSTAPRG